MSRLVLTNTIWLTVCGFESAAPLVEEERAVR